MITALTGVIRGFGPSCVYLDVNGIEYEIILPVSSLEQLQKQFQIHLSQNSNYPPSQKTSGKISREVSQKNFQKEKVRLLIYHHFTDKEERLYGFLEARQRLFFKSLLSLHGLGTSLAISILSHLTGPRLLEVCNSKDHKVLCRIPKVGRRTAESIIFEVSRNPKKWSNLLIEDSTSSFAESDVKNVLPEQEIARQALLQLGYREKEAESALEKTVEMLKKDDSEITDPKLIHAAEWIRLALQSM